MDDQFRDLPIDQLTEPWVLLRPVLRDSVVYLEMRDSIEAKGFLNSIAARPSPRRLESYEVIDGMWRWTCAKELGLPSIPTIIKHGISDDDVLALQIQANAIRPDTKPCEFAKQLQRIQKTKSDMTLAELAVMVSKSPQWIQHQLGLLKLDPRTQKAIDRGEICLSNGYMLSKLPTRFRGDYVQRAKTMPSKDFKALVAAFIKQYREAVRQGRLDAIFTEEFQPQAYLRPVKAVEAEVQRPCEGPLILSAEGCQTPLDGWMAALKWAMHLDENSVREQEEAVRGRARKRWSQRGGV